MIPVPDVPTPAKTRPLPTNATLHRGLTKWLGAVLQQGLPCGNAGVLGKCQLGRMAAERGKSKADDLPSFSVSLGSKNPDRSGNVMHESC